MALVTCNQLTQALAGLLAQLNNETMWVQGGRLYLQQGDGRTINVDMVPGLLPLLETMNVCNVWMQGDDMHTQDRKYTSTDVLATCNGLYRVWEQLSNRIDNLPVDRFVSGMHSYNPATKVLTLIMSDNTVVDIPLTDLIGDILDSIQLQLRDCNGDPLEQDAQVPTCAQMNAALVTLETTLSQALEDGVANIEAALDSDYQRKLQDANGNALPGGTQVYSTAQTNSAINAAVTAAVANLQARLRDCNSALIPLDTPIPTCAQMNVAIGNALASLPTEVHVVSGAYNAATDTLVLTMNTGPAVSIPLTTLINDAVAAAQTAVQYATIAEVVSGTGGAKTVAPGVAKQRTDIAVFGSGAAANRPSPTAYNGVAIGHNAAGGNTINSADTVVGYNAFRLYDGAVMTAPQGANTIYGTATLANFTNAATPSATGNMTAVGFQAGLGVVGGERSVLVGAAGPNHTAPSAFLSDVVMIGDGAGQIGSGSPLSSVSSYGDICIGRYAGLRKIGAATPSQAGVYIGFNAGQSAYAQSGNTQNVYIGAGAGSQSLGGETVAIGNGAYQGGLGYRVVAVGSNAAKNNLASHSTYVGENTRGVNTILGTTTVDTTNSLVQDGLGYYLDLPSGSLLAGVPYRIRFYTGLAGAGDVMSGAYTGIAQALPGLDRIYLPRWDVTNTPGEVPYNAANIQSVSLDRFDVLDNSTALGRDAIINASNTVFLGNAATTAVRSTGTFYSAGVALTSDERLKSAISDLDMPAARAFVKGLRFVEYTKHANYIAVRAQLEAHLALAISDKDEAAIAYRQAALDAFDENEVKGPGRREAGLIAQEVKTLAEQHGFGYVVSEDTNGVLSLDYNSIQAIINAVVIDALEL